MSVSTTTLAEFRNRIAKRLDDPSMIMWSSTELRNLINEALLTFQAISGYQIKTQEISVEAEMWKYDLSSEISVSYSNAELETVLKSTLLEPSAYTDHYSAPVDMYTSAIKNIRRHWQEATKLQVSYRTIDASGIFIDLGIGHLLPVHVEWKPYARTRRRRLDREDQQGMIYTGVPNLGKPHSYSLQATNQLRLIPSPDELGEIEIFEVVESDLIPHSVRWALKYGALAQLLATDGQLRDPQRAEYARKRYEDAVMIANQLPLYRNMFLNEKPISITSLADLSSQETQWRGAEGLPKTVAMVGWNQILFYPHLASGAVSSTLKMDLYVPEADLVADSDLLWVGAEFENVLEDFVVHLALFKVSGVEFAATMPAYEGLLKAAAEYNSKLAVLLPNLSVGKEKAKLEKVWRMQERSDGE